MFRTQKPTIADWYQDKRWVYSITFDEALADLHRCAVPILQTAGVPGHVEVVVGQMGQVRAIGDSSYNGRRHMNADELRALLAMGWGVGNHSWSHGEVNAQTAALELERAKVVLETAIGGPVSVYCSPNDNRNMNAEALAACRRLGYLAAMSLTDALNRPEPDDLLWLNRTFLHTQGYGPFFSEFDPWRNLRHAHEQRGWVIDYCHCPLERAVHPNKDCSAAELRRRLEAVRAGGVDGVWLARVEDAVDYRYTRRAFLLQGGEGPDEFVISAPGLPEAVRRRVVTLRLPPDTERVWVNGVEVPGGKLLDVDLRETVRLRLAVREHVEVGRVAKFGAAAQAGLQGKLPQPYPRPMAASTLKYLTEVVNRGLASDMVERFEQTFAEMLGVKHCVATPGCTNAMAVLALALGLKPGDEIVTSPISDYGSVMGFINAGVIPVFADIGTTPGDPNVTAESLAACIGPRTRALVCVHMTGVICDMDPIRELARRHGLTLIEDACQAMLGCYRGRLAGTLGDAAVFSFDSEKTIGSDIGGCLVTNDDRLAAAARFAGHARGAEQREGYGRVHTAPGLALRMPQCTAAMTLAQLEEAPARIAARDSAARRILRGLAEIPGIVPMHASGHLNPLSCWMLGFNLSEGAFRCTADEFGRQLAEAGVPGAGTARYYLLPEALPFLRERAERRHWPYDAATTDRRHRYAADTVPRAARFMDTFIRWFTFCEKYTAADADLAVDLVRQVAERNRA
jgi:dTDP-4-amino-4,6-dideoxygalactose transaminase/peptidoglycan/xylan/chitin deacetylase (PgdA/CDA1 family)